MTAQKYGWTGSDDVVEASDVREAAAKLVALDVARQSERMDSPFDASAPEFESGDEAMATFSTASHRFSVFPVALRGAFMPKPE